ncbi:Mechanosensitive ion channel-domain-containing protein, partial [Hysterangium stoloniferum]
FIFIVPVLALLWIPGILGLTAFPNTRIWGVKLLWWSVWLSVAWGGWWASLAFALTLPRIARYTIGAVSATSRTYISWLAALHRYIALFIWSLVIWIAWQPLIEHNQDKSPTTQTYPEISFIARLLFGILLCVIVLLGEKFSIQVIAGKFHERSYAERIEDQKKAIHILVVLYQHSSDVAGRPDPLNSEQPTKSNLDPSEMFKRAIEGVKDVAQTTTTVFGNLATEIAGTSVLQPNSPQAMVSAALESVNKSRLLARRLFRSFVRPKMDVLYPLDIEKFFNSREEADDAFTFFDKDRNGDATLDEVEMACMYCHREQLSIANSMKDLDSAVGRLDNIFMSFYSLIVLLIIAVVLDSQLSSIVAGAGTFILGLSWLIGGSLAEVLTSIIFLFIKHPYDVGDRVVVDNIGYTVKEIGLLSTVFLDQNNTSVQAPHLILNGKLISNIRRSPNMSETFTFDVAFDTTFEQIEALRDKMVAFVSKERRDFLPSFDVVVVDIPEQDKITLTADIKYKSNWQQGALKTSRRNKWICTLKQCLSELKIYGPDGAGKPAGPAGPTKYTQIPWDEVKQMETFAAQNLEFAVPQSSIGVNYRFADKNAVLLDSSPDVFGEAEQLAMRTPQSTLPRPVPLPQTSEANSSNQRVEVIEMPSPAGNSK